MENLAAVWEPPFGDRRQELVFIGVDLNRLEMEAELEAALLTDVEMEMGPTACKRLHNPFEALFTDRETTAA